MQPFQYMERFHPPAGHEIDVPQWSSRCSHCGKELVLASQMEENIRARSARKACYGEYLLGEEIFAFRRRYGLTQQAFSRIFGKGIIAFSRYESEKSYPDLSLTRLLTLAMSDPTTMKALADKAGIELPLWRGPALTGQQIKARLMSTSTLPRKRTSYRHGPRRPSSRDMFEVAA